MARYESRKIFEVISDIEDGKMLLPALQRNFVWSEAKICDLFESLMHDYPIGTFLFWKLNNNQMSNYVFNSFINSFDERKGKNNQRGDRVTSFSKDEYIGVLDGQQRLTSIYVGVQGSFQTKISGRKKDDPNAYEDRYLCLNVFHDPDIRQDTENVFSFKLNNEIMKPDDDNTYYWIKVKDIFDAGPNATVASIKKDIKKNSFPKGLPFEDEEKLENNLESLKGLLFARENINYYTCIDDNLDSVVDIFVRVNSGGENLQSSDLILSVSAIHAPNEDFHVMLVDSVAQINALLDGTTYADNNFMIRAGLMFTGAAKISLNSSDSWSVQRTKIIYDNFSNIMAAMEYTIKILNVSGIKVSRIPKNIFLSIAYYFYRKPQLQKKDSETSDIEKYRKERVLIRQFALRGTFAGLFDSSTSAVLTNVRKTIDKAIDSKKAYFPLDDLMEELGDKLRITPDVMGEIFKMTYGDSKIDPLLRELRGVNTNETTQVDHIWPKTYMESFEKWHKVIPNGDNEQFESYREKRHNLANLQLLVGHDNDSKNGKLFDEWASEEGIDENFIEKHCIPLKADKTVYSFSEYETFLEERKKIMEEKISKAFPDSFDDIMKAFEEKKVVKNKGKK